MIQCVEHIVCVQTGVCCNKQSVFVTIWETEQRHRCWLLNWKVGLNVHSKWRNFLSVITIKPIPNLFFPAPNITLSFPTMHRSSKGPVFFFFQIFRWKFFLNILRLIHLLYMSRPWFFDNIVWKVQSCKSSLLLHLMPQVQINSQLFVRKHSSCT